MPAGIGSAPLSRTQAASVAVMGVADRKRTGSRGGCSGRSGMSLWPNNTAVNGTRPDGRAHSGEPRSISASAASTMPSTAGAAASIARLRGMPVAGPGSRRRSTISARGPRARDRRGSPSDRSSDGASNPATRNAPIRLHRSGIVAPRWVRHPECHTRRIGLGVHTCRSEVAAQVCAHLRQRVCHSASDGTMVRFTPESASKTASFAVSKASSTDCPMAAFDSAGTLATN